MLEPRVAPAGMTAAVAEFSFAGATLVVEEFGHGERTLVLIHGIGLGRSAYAGLARRLSGRIIVMDLPGYGDAPEPARTLTMERTGDLVAALLRDRGVDGAVVVGHSMGTQVATEIAVRHPSLVAALVLIAPTVDRRARTPARQLMRLMHDLAIESPRVLVVGGREYLRAGPHLRRKLRAMLAHRPEDSYPRVRVPTLVLRGEEDRVSPRAWCRHVLAALPDGTLVEVPGHGHETMIRDAEPSADFIVRFLVDRVSKDVEAPHED